MTASSPMGTLYRCPQCGSELVVLSATMGNFTPRCCNRPMQAQAQKAAFYDCPVCCSQIMVVRKGLGTFAPRCCNRPMLQRQAG